MVEEKTCQALSKPEQVDGGGRRIVLESREGLGAHPSPPYIEGRCGQGFPALGRVLPQVGSQEVNSLYLSRSFLAVRALLALLGEASGLHTNFAKCFVLLIACSDETATQATTVSWLRSR